MNIISYTIVEQWDIEKNDRLHKMIPINEIKEILGRDPMIEILLDNDIKKKYPSQYNLALITRAHNEGFKDLIEKYYEIYQDSFKLDKLLGIKLPQILWTDNLGYKQPIISLHISKLNSTEIYINDIIFLKDTTNSLGHGIFDQVLNNLKLFAKKEGIIYISGHAVNTKVFSVFKKKGFIADKREDMYNDVLWRVSQFTNKQIPFYKRIC